MAAETVPSPPRWTRALTRCCTWPAWRDVLSATERSELVGYLRARTP